MAPIPCPPRYPESGSLSAPLSHLRHRPRGVGGNSFTQNIAEVLRPDAGGPGTKKPRSRGGGGRSGLSKVTTRPTIHGAQAQRKGPLTGGVLVGKYRSRANTSF